MTDDKEPQLLPKRPRDSEAPSLGVLQRIGRAIHRAATESLYFFDLGGVSELDLSTVLEGNTIRITTKSGTDYTFLAKRREGEREGIEFVCIASSNPEHIGARIKDPKRIISKKGLCLRQTSKGGTSSETDTTSIQEKSIWLFR